MTWTGRMLCVLICTLALILPSTLQAESIQTANEEGRRSVSTGRQSSMLNQVILVFGVIFILLEVIVWRKEQAEQSLISFSVFKKDLQDLPSHTQSHNDFSSGKNEGLGEEVIVKEQNDSPGIKTIKSMTQDSDESQERKRRKRKADKLSDRRSDRKDQNSMES